MFLYNATRLLGRVLWSTFTTYLLVSALYFAVLLVLHKAIYIFPVLLFAVCVSLIVHKLQQLVAVKSKNRVQLTLPSWFQRGWFLLCSIIEVIMLIIAFYFTFISDRPDTDTFKETYNVLTGNDSRETSYVILRATPAPVQRELIVTVVAQYLINNYVDDMVELRESYTDLDEALIDELANLQRGKIDDSITMLDDIMHGINQQTTICVFLWLFVGFVHTPGAIYMHRKRVENA